MYSVDHGLPGRMGSNFMGDFSALWNSKDINSGIKS